MFLQLDVGEIVDLIRSPEDHNRRDSSRAAFLGHEGCISTRVRKKEEVQTSWEVSGGSLQLHLHYKSRDDQDIPCQPCADLIYSSMLRFYFEVFMSTRHI